MQEQLLTGNTDKLKTLAGPWALKAKESAVSKSLSFLKSSQTFLSFRQEAPNPDSLRAVLSVGLWGLKSSSRGGLVPCEA